MPRLEPLYQKYKHKGLSIIAVEAKRDRERALKFIEENKLTYTFLETGEEGDNIVREIFEVRSFPTSFLVNQDGKIIFVHIGFSSGAEENLEKEIDQLLAG